MRVLVTGAAGFIGSNLARALLDRGDTVIGVDSLTDYYDPELKRANVRSLERDGFVFWQKDVLTISGDELAAEGVEGIVHLAGQPGVRKSWGRDFSTYTRGNIDATQGLLEAVTAMGGLQRFVFASSSSIYGQAETFPTRETALPRPFSPYGVTKLAAEHLVGLYRENFGVPSTSFRFFTVYGPGQRPDMAFTRFLRAAVEDSPIVVFGDGEQIRDFTFVGDIVSALVAALDARHELPTTMNLSGGSSVSVNEVIETIREVTGRPVAVDYHDTVRGDVFRTGGDSSLAREALGWIPSVTLREGLERQLDWLRSL